MKPKTEHQTVVIDMSNDEASVTHAGSRLPVVLALLSMLSVTGLGVLGYFYWLNMQQDMQQMLGRVQAAAALTEQLQNSVRQTRQALQTQQTLLDQQSNHTVPQQEALQQQQQAFKQQADLLTVERNRMQQREVELRATIADLRKRLGNPDAEWMVAEAEYLMKLAQQRIDLAKDKKTALAALRQADQRLQDTGDPQWGLVRDQLLRDMAKLQAFKPLDIQHSLGRLDSLNELFSRLRPRLIAAENVESAKTAHPVESDAEGVDGVEKIAADLWQGLKSSVKIRRHDQPVTSLLTHGQESLILQNLGLILETARWALVQRKTALYQDSLKRMLEWLHRYYVLDNDTGAQVVAEIKALQSIDLTPALPDISLALRALQTTRQLKPAGVAQ